MKYGMKKILVWFLAFTWELPQTLFALVLMVFLKTTPLDHKKRIRRVHSNSYLTCFSLGEFIFFRWKDIGAWDWEETQRHELGHSVQSRILGPLYLLLVGLPSVIWNAMSRMDNMTGRWMAANYYRTPWEHLADVHGKVER